MPTHRARWQKRSWPSEHSNSENVFDRVSPLDSSLPVEMGETATPAFTGLGIGTWAWGDEKWGYGREDANYDDESLLAAFNTAVASGVTMFDTSEVYGGSHAETLLGRCLKQTKAECFIATKWHPRANSSIFQKCYNDSVVESMRRTLLGSKERLGVSCVDLFQLHSGSEYYGSLEEYADGLAAMVREGHARFVGASNIDAPRVRRIYQRLSETHGIHLFSNQVEFSLLEPGIAKDGTLEECTRLGVRILAYCPLGMGRLTGKYSIENEPRFFGYGNKSYRYHGALPWPRIQCILDACREIGNRRNVSIPQVALGWCIAKGTIPIPGAKTAAQAHDNCKALECTLSKTDIEKLDHAVLEEASTQNPHPRRRKGGGKGKGKGTRD